MNPKTCLSILLLVMGTLGAPQQAAGDPPPSCQRRIADHPFQCSPTLMDMRAIQTTIEAYAIDHATYPMAKTMSELRDLVQPTYIATTPMTDAWGTEFRYVVSADGSSYRLVSAGSDRVFDEESWSAPGFLSDSKQDTVLSSDGAAGSREWVIQE
jgi:hypothetical protein